MENPSNHKNLGKKGTIWACPYPATPFGAHRTRTFCLVGRENNHRASASASARSSMGTPWFVIWKMAHSSPACLMSLSESGSDKLMTGTNNVNRWLKGGVGSGVGLDHASCMEAMYGKVDSDIESIIGVFRGEIESVCTLQW
ncbi:hypothetical protein Ancab_006947 [Ancistrocladus abbreviatus]